MVWGIWLIYYMLKVYTTQIIVSQYFALIHSKLEHVIICYEGTYKFTLGSLIKSYTNI